MKKLFGGIVILVISAFLLYILGPRRSFLSFDNEPLEDIPHIKEIERFVSTEKLDSRIRPGTASQIIWHDSIEKTPFALVYFHGFSATHPEGFPIHNRIAARFGMNLLLTRFPDHGLLDSNSYRDIQPKEWIDYGKQAIAIGKAMGEKVIVMSTSTGSTISIYLAAKDPDIVGQILMSPNIDLYDTNSNLLNGPWGFQLGKLVLGSEYRHINGPDSVRKYWTMDYHIDGLIALRELLDQTMKTEIFRLIEKPVLLGYYYKDEENQDKIVSIDAMNRFMNTISTPSELKVMKAFPDAGNHVIGSVYWNPNWSKVEYEVIKFLEQTMKIPLHNTLNQAGVLSR